MDLREGIAILLAGIRIAEIVEDHRPRQERREIERRKLESAVNRGQGAFKVAGGLAHRRELDPQVGSVGAGLSNLLQHRPRSNEIADRGGTICLLLLIAYLRLHFMEQVIKSNAM